MGARHHRWDADARVGNGRGVVAVDAKGASSTARLEARRWPGSSFRRAPGGLGPEPSTTTTGGCMCLTRSPMGSGAIPHAGSISISRRTTTLTAGVPNLTDTIDFAVASGDVFFLHADGQLTRCAFNPLYVRPGGGKRRQRVRPGPLQRYPRGTWARAAHCGRADPRWPTTSRPSPPCSSSILRPGGVPLRLALNFLVRFG